MSEYKYYIQNIYQPSSDQVIIEAGDKNGRPVFNYRPGQYAMISYRNERGQFEDKHAFSLSSSPKNTKTVSFGIKLEGKFTHGLLNLRIGDELRVFGPYGSFCYDETKYPNVVMIAGGIGITPFYSALNYANDLQLENKLSLIYSARTSAGATFYPEINILQTKNQNLRTLFSFTEETGIPGGNNIIHERLNAQIISNFVGNISDKTFFICGPSLFMAAMVANLLSLGVNRSQIKMEEFSMIPDKAFWPRIFNFSYALAFSILVFVISFSLVYKTTGTSLKITYDANQLALINKANYERLAAIYDNKNKALSNLNQQILAATNNKGGQISNVSVSSSSSGSGNIPLVPSNNSIGVPVSSVPNAPVSNPVVNVPTPVVPAPAPVYRPAPVYTPPAPVTSASPVR